MTLAQLQVASRVNAPNNVIESNVRDAVTRNVRQWQARPCHIIGGGPSFDPATYWERDDVPSFALNNAGSLLNRPTYIVMMDARPENAQMNVIKQAKQNSIYLLASQVHPDVYDDLEDQSAKIQQWHAGGSEVLKKMGIKGVGGGGTVLTRAVPIAYEMGFRQFHLYGVDSSYADDGRHHAYPQAMNDGAKTVEVFTPHKRTRFVTTGALAEQAQQCITQWQTFEQFGCEFHVYGDGLLPAMWREAKEAKEDVNLSEPAKYREIWANPAYRKWSPGETSYERILEALKMPKSSKVIDFGCGTGRLAFRLAQQHDVLGVDFADNCLDDAVKARGRFPFVVANLWDFRRHGYDYGVCSDVMEHIPPEKVDAVLSNIAASVKECAFTISFVPDVFGQTIGKPLHLTVRPPDWWLSKLEEHFGLVTYRGGGLFIANQE